MSNRQIAQEFSKTQGEALLSGSDIWQTFLRKQSEFSARATRALNALIVQIPADTVPACLDMLHVANRQTDAVSFEKHTMGVWFTMSRLMGLRRESSEQMNVSSAKFSVPNPDGLTFEALKGEDGTPIHRQIIIEDHFTIFRDNKPFIYKAKYQPARRFGSVGKIDANNHKSERNVYHDHNLLLKYQSAIEHGLISGAAIEIRGLVDTKFMEWACGTNVFNAGAVPDVQLIYNLMLPSGAEYRFTLKKASDPAKEIKVENPMQSYTSQDLEVIRGIEIALDNPSQREIYEIVSGTNVFSPTASLSRYFQNNASVTYDDIKDQAIYDEYIRNIQNGVWERARNIRPERYNLNADTVFADRNAGLEGDAVTLEEKVEEFQEYLRSNPDVARTKTNYILGEKGTQAYEDKKREVVAVFAKNLSLVRSRELLRRQDAGFSSLCADRETMGWRGPQDGVGLSVEHIMFDSIVEVVARGPGKKGRSYDPTDRFMNIDQIMEHLSREDDRQCFQIQIHDPLTGKGEDQKKAHSIHYKDASEQKYQRVMRDARNENIERAYAYLGLARKDKDANNKKPGRKNTLTPKQVLLELLSQSKKPLSIKTALREKSAYLQDLYEDLVKTKAQIGETSSELAAYCRAHKIKKLDADHPLILAREKAFLQVNDLEDKIWTAMDSIFDVGTKRKLFVQVFSRKENIMKFIYAVGPDNRIVFDEESRIHSNFGRASHSELVGGQFCYGAGEMVFARDEQAKRWVLKEINNGSGHYRPHTQTLSFVANVFVHELERHYLRQGHSVPEAESVVAAFVKKTRLFDAIARGRQLRDEKIFPSAGVRMATAAVGEALSSQSLSSFTRAL